MKKTKDKDIKRAPLNVKKKSIANFESNKYFDVIGLGIMILLGILIYSNSFNCSFQLDDHQNIVDNASIRNLSDIKTIYNSNDHSRFIPYLSFAFNYHFGKLNVWGYHIVNLIIHLLNSCLVWWLTLLLFSSPNMKNIFFARNKNLIAIITALLFVSHPLATQSVTYIVQRMASMAALFCFLSICLYLKARLLDKGNNLKYLLFAGALVSSILAMLSKENSFILPFVILLLEICFFQSIGFSINFKDYKIIIIFILFIGFIFFVFFKFSSGIFKTILPGEYNDFRTITSMNYLFTQFSVIVKYLQLLLLPVNQNLDYDFPLSNSFFDFGTLLSFLFLLLIVILGIYFFRKNRLISFGIFWFFLTLLIESSIIPINDLIFEHRTYLPSFGFYLIITSLFFLFLWDKYKNIAVTLLLIVVVSNSYLTYARNMIWKDEVTLWNDVISKSPNKARSYSERGVVYFHQKKNSQALSDFNKAIELKPSYIRVLKNRSGLFWQEKKLKEAIMDYTHLLELDPKSSEMYYNRGLVFNYEKRSSEAFNDFCKAIEYNPKYSEAYYNRSVSLIEEKKYVEAINDLNTAIKLNPKYDKAYNNRANVLQILNRNEEALDDYKKIIEIKPEYPEAYFSRGHLLMKLSKDEESLLDFDKVIELKPDYLNAYIDKGAILFKQMKYQEAIANYTRAINIKADYSEAFCNRGKAEYKLGRKENACMDWKKASEIGYREANELFNKFCR